MERDILTGRTFKRLRVKIMPGGDAYFIYDDDHPARNVGKLELKRASNVLWNEGKQRWFIRMVRRAVHEDEFIEGPAEVIGDPHGYTSRTQAITAEVQILSQMLSDGTARVEELFS